MNQLPKDHPLQSAPKLWHWYRARHIERPKHTYEVFLWNLVRAALTSGRESTRYWVQGFETLLRTSQNLLEDFLLADSLSQELGKPVTELLSLLCEQSIRVGDGPRGFAAIQLLAARTNLSALRFLSAWMALNLGDLETCIQECEKEVEPHATIHTLLGQALLEIGRPEEAIDALKVAVKLDPSDPLPAFQLVKALLVGCKADEAIHYVQDCRRLTGENNTEVECLSALVAIADNGTNEKFAHDTGQRLLNHFLEDPGNLELLCLSFEVCEIISNQNSLAQLFETADFRALSSQRGFTQRIGGILRKLGDKGWFSLSKKVSEKLLEAHGGTALTRQ